MIIHRYFIVSNAICILFLYGGTDAHLMQDIEASTPTTVTRVNHPFKDTSIFDMATYTLSLKLFDKEPNKILDEEEWFDVNHLPQPRPAIEKCTIIVPQHTKYGTLIFLRQSGDLAYAVYEKTYIMDNAIDIYDTGHRYTLVILDNALFEKAYALHALFPDILEMCWLDARGKLVYFNAAYNGYAELRGDSTGYLYCLDIDNGKLAWATKNLISSYFGFTVYEDYVITGYGFTAEPDFLYLINRYTGEIVQTIPIKTAHEYIILKKKLCYVRTYNMNYVFTLDKSEK